MLVAASGCFALFLAGLPWRWFIAAGASVVRRAHALAELLKVLHDKPRLVWSQG